MPHRPTARSVIATVLAVLAVLAGACSGSDEADDDPLVGSGTTVADDEAVVIVATFTDQADLSGIDASASWADRGQQVIDALQATATRSQADALALARDAGVPATSYWLTNALVFEGDRALADRVAELPGVATVEVEPVHGHVRADDLTAVDAADVPAVTWNVEAVGAPTAWASGRDGDGATIGVVDTGIDAGHPALRSSWSGRWFDATGTCGDIPCDPDGHGTAVAGLAVGGDPSDPSIPAVGVAPAADVLAARACDGTGCRTSHLLAALQWVLAPTGDDGAPDPGLRPTVVVGAWELISDDDALDRVPGVLAAAGVVTVLAAGDDGPACGTVGAPADQPAAVAVGAATRDGGVDDASARGPAPDGTPKPDLLAPGVDVTSAAPDGGWAAGSGTSLAAPQVAGAIALAVGDGPPPEPSDVVGQVLAAARRLDAADPCAGGGSAGTTAPAGDDTTGAGLLDVAGLVARTAPQTGS